MSNESTNPELSIYLRADWLAGFLRADRVRFDTLVQLVAAWSDPDKRDEIIEHLDALAKVVSSPQNGTDLDAAVEAVEGVAGMDLAQVPIDRDAALRLTREVFDVTEKLCRFDRVEDGVRLSVPRQPHERDL